MEKLTAHWNQRKKWEQRMVVLFPVLFFMLAVVAPVKQHLWILGLIVPIAILGIIYNIGLSWRVRRALGWSPYQGKLAGGMQVESMDTKPAYWWKPWSYLGRGQETVFLFVIEDPSPFSVYIVYQPHGANAMIHARSCAPKAFAVQARHTQFTVFAISQDGACSHRIGFANTLKRSYLSEEIPLY